MRVHGLLLLLLVAPDASPAVQAGDALPSAVERTTVVLRIDDEEVSEGVYGDWLVRNEGEGLAPFFAFRWLVLREAEEHGVARDPEAVAAAVDAEVQRRVGAAFSSNHALWLAELERAGRTERGRALERALELEVDLLLSRIGEREDPPRTADEVRSRILRMQTIAVLDALYDRAPEPTSVLPSGEPVLRVCDEPIARGELAAFLLRYRGEVAAASFADAWRLQSAARAAGLDVTDEEVAARVQEDIASVIETRHQGQREHWLGWLENRGQTPEAYARSLGPATRRELLMEKLVRLRRVVADEDVAAEWERVYGPGGRSVELRWIRLDLPLPSASDPDERRRIVERLAPIVKNRAEELRARIQNGADFAALAAQHSDDAATAANGGAAPEGFRIERLPSGLAQDVAPLMPGEISAPLRAGNSFWLFEVVAIREVPLEEARLELVKRLRARRATPVELAKLRRELAAERPIERLDALFD